MKSKSLLFSVGLFGLIAIATPSLLSAETPKEILERMKKKNESVKSWEMTMETNTKSQFMDMTGVMKSVNKRDGDKVKSYSEMTSEMKIQGMPQVQKSESKIINDGSAIWIESKTGDSVSVMKSPYKVDPSSVSSLEAMLEDGKWEVKPNESINGEDCSVLNYTTGEPAQPTKITYWMSEKSGQPLQIVVDNGTMGTNTTKITNYKENPTVDDSKFTYTPPAGVQVMDASAIPGASGAGPGKAPKIPVGPGAPKGSMAPTK